MERKYRSRLLLLREWRSVVRSILQAVEGLYPEAEVYLIGGVAENRTTVNSDVDIAIVFKSSLSKNSRISILTRIWESIEDAVPMYYPLEIHVLDVNEFAKLKGRKVKLSKTASRLL